VIAGAAVAPVAPAAGAEVTAPYAATPKAESSVAGAAAAPATELLAEADTQESSATPVATVAVDAPAAVPAEAETEAAPTAVFKSTPAAAITAATATSAAVAEVDADSGSAVNDQMAGKQAGPATTVTQHGSFPAWIGLGIQTAALLAALATLIFAILWWRSRSPQPRT